MAGKKTKKTGAKAKTKKSTARASTRAAAKRSSSADPTPPALCAARALPPRPLDASLAPERVRLIQRTEKKWVNGTVLHYYFFRQPARWRAASGEEDVVRKAFETWKKVGIGLDFQEVDSAGEAEIRIGFLRGDGAWSYIGKDILRFGATERTMNFGWDLRRAGEIDTAIHEIGHTLAFPHEHQNPNAGIEWDDEAVYAWLAQPPNEWDRETTFHNVIRKISPDEIQGSSWDPNSIMHYPFGPNLILRPTQYRDGLRPAPGLSDRDKQWVKSFYPPLKEDDHLKLQPFSSRRLTLDPGQQIDFVVEPRASRVYRFATFGVSDTVMVLFEDVGGTPRYRGGDDDSGADRNAFLQAKLWAGRKYFLRIRLYYQFARGETAVMMW